MDIECGQLERVWDWDAEELRPSPRETTKSNSESCDKIRVLYQRDTFDVLVVEKLDVYGAHSVKCLY